MEEISGVIMIGAACGAVLLISALRRRTELLLGFLVRGGLGTAAIYFINAFLASQGLARGVGIGAVSVLVSGILGLPGVALLYGINICRIWLA